MDFRFPALLYNAGVELRRFHRLGEVFCVCFESEVAVTSFGVIPSDVRLFVADIHDSHNAVELGVPTV